MIPTTYEVQVIGDVPEDVFRELGGVMITERQTRSVVTGRFRDQAELHGFLQRLRAFGLELVELRVVPPEGVAGRAEGGDR